MQDTLARKAKHLDVYLTAHENEARYYALWGSNFEGLLRTEAGLGPPADGSGWLYWIDPLALGEVRVRYVPPTAIGGWVKVDTPEGEQ